MLEEDEAYCDRTAEQQAEAEAAIEKPLSLNQQRLDAVVTALKSKGAKKIVDLGCGQGHL
ncbi:hypothetical protein RintRC_7189 [Richelia intracellularis]|nr:hypothetical protein RintRC_7189 [Richelia intracellularis]